MKRIILSPLLVFLVTILSAQVSDSLSLIQGDSISIQPYTSPQDFEIGGVEVSGAYYSDDNAFISLAGFKTGKNIRIPGGDIPKAIKALWKLRLFTDVQILLQKTIGNVVFLEIAVKERPRLSKYSYEGAK